MPSDDSIEILVADDTLHKTLSTDPSDLAAKLAKALQPIREDQTKGRIARTSHHRRHPFFFRLMQHRADFPSVP